MTVALLIGGFFGGIGVVFGLVWMAAEWVPECLSRRRDRIARDNDDGAPIYRRLLELIEAHPEEWRKVEYRTWELPRAKIRVAMSHYSAQLNIEGTRLNPGSAWQRAIIAAFDKIEADHLKAASLNAICDAIESMGRNNVIPMKRAG